MINIVERQSDVLSLISHLDITPTMYENAVDKYKAIAAFLEDCGIEADIYPQGSFAFGTVVRPIMENEEANYDLDFICQVRTKKDNTTPSVLRKTIEEALSSSGRYGGKLVVYPECFTVEYADVNGVGFNIDIVPAVSESDSIISTLKMYSTRADLLDTAIAIPQENREKNYNWLTNNPKGFIQWFDEINAPFLEAHQHETRHRIFEENRHMFASVEDVPSALDRSSLQRVIQILKYHRNTYYAKLPNGGDIKPISAIINVLATKIAESAKPQMDVFALLAYVLSELDIYSKHMTLDEDEFIMKYGQRSSISHHGEKWVITNPANPGDNLADKWNENDEIPKVFFKWLSICKMDILDALSLPDNQFYTSISNAFGENTVRRLWGTKYQLTPPKPINIATASKPYCKL